MSATESHEPTKRLASDEMAEMAARNAQAQTIDSAEMAKSCPARIGKYPVQRFLTSGGMGQIYLGTHPQLNVPVVIKVIRPEYSQNPRYVERFMKEARLASKLNHPNIVRVYDADRDGDTCFIVQEYVDGGDLSLLLRSTDSGAVDPDRALEVITGVARGFVAAEKAGIVHRDIKPANILLDRDGEPKIADLGLAKHYTYQNTDPSDPRLTQEGTKIGSPAYMAPEQVAENGTVDIRTDIYALGVTFYELLTGEMPFSGTSMREMLAKHLVKDVDDPCRANPKIPRRVGRIVRKMAARRPEDRFQTAPELLAALRRAAQPWVRRHWVAAAAVLLLAAVSATAVITYSLAPPGRSPLDAVQAYLAQGQAKRAIPVLEKLVRSDPRNVRVWYALGLCRLDQADAEGIDEAVGKLGELPDGKELAAHLTALRAMKEGKAEFAMRIVTEWEKKAVYPLPLLYAKGMVLFKEQEYDGARKDLEKAVGEASVFGFQRFAVVDALARLFTVTKQPDRAKAVYASAFRSKTDPRALRPSFYTNYAVTLMNAGDAAGAAKPLRMALELNPKDPFARYLEKVAARAAGRTAADRIQATLRMIDDVSASLAKQTRSGDDWSSPPLVLTFLPPENLTPANGRMGEEKYLADLLTEAVQSRNSIPVVDRESLEEILREHKISASDLSSPAARLKIGGFLPASILVRTRFSLDDQLTVRLQLIDVSTSENLAILTEQIPKDGNREALAAMLAGKLMSALLARKPIQGKVITTGGGTFDINVGRYHGLAPGRTIAVYPAGKGVSARGLRRRKPLLEGRVEDVGRFEATVQLKTGGQTVAPGMLVLASAGGPSRK